VSTPRTLRVRTRLTLWYVATLAAVLVLYTVISGAIDYWQVTRQIYHDQIQDMETVEGLLYFTADGRLSLNEDYHTSLADRRRVDRYMEVLDPAGAVLFRNDRTASLDLGGPVQPGEGRAFDQRHIDLPNGSCCPSHSSPRRSPAAIWCVTHWTHSPVWPPRPNA
jgi:hypothetical protein